MTRSHPCVLTIAGSDSGGGAGIQADIKTFAAFGVYGASVITSVTAQNTVNVRAIHDIPVDVIAAQIDAVFDDLPVSAVKIGMLSSADIIHVVADRLMAYHAANIVLDPVMVATSGDSLLKNSAVQAMINELLPLATLLTPNMPETAFLLRQERVTDTEHAANAILQLGPAAVLIKGGHACNDMLEDLLVMRGLPQPIRMCHPRMMTDNTHGTGCTLSSAIAAGLALGYTLPDAVSEAITWLQGAITNAWPLGAGHGPVNHFWQLWPKETSNDG